MARSEKGDQVESHLQFRVVDGQVEKDLILTLDQEQFDLGRLPRDYEPTERELLFREPTLSRVHATLTWQPRKWGYELEHKSEVNPTLVNGRSITKRLLAPGDRVQMGLLILELEETRRGKAYPQKRDHRKEREERRQKLYAIVAEVEQEFSHVKLDRP